MVSKKDKERKALDQMVAGLSSKYYPYDSRQDMNRGVPRSAHFRGGHSLGIEVARIVPIIIYHKVVDRTKINWFCFATDAPAADATKDGKLPTTAGEHDMLGVIPYNEYGGGTYKYIAKGIRARDLDKA
jgi:hypothetical protein